VLYEQLKKTEAIMKDLEEKSTKEITKLTQDSTTFKEEIKRKEQGNSEFC
jgi:hypothetical protein